MFYQTYTARKPPSACAPVTPLPPPPGGHGMVPSPAAPLLRTAKALQCIANGDMTQQFSQFCPW